MLLLCCVYGIRLAAQDKREMLTLGTALSSDSTVFMPNDDAKLSKVAWGIKIGVNYSNFYGSGITDIFANDKTSYQPGGGAGIFVSSNMGKHFSLIHELWYTRKQIGVMFEDNEQVVYPSKLSMHYLELMPANFTYKTGCFMVYVGPYVSALSMANIQRRDDSGDVIRDKYIFGDPSNHESTNKYLQKIDFGLNGGIGFQIGGHWQIDLGYRHGLTDIFQYASSYDSNDSKHQIKIYQRSLMCSLGYAF